MWRHLQAATPPSQVQRGSGLAASDVSAPVCANGVRPPLAFECAQNKPSTTLSSNNQPIDLLMDCTDSRMAAQHLPQDLVRASSGQQQLAHTKHGNRSYFLPGFAG